MVFELECLLRDWLDEDRLDESSFDLIPAQRAIFDHFDEASIALRLEMDGTARNTSPCGKSNTLHGVASSSRRIYNEIRGSSFNPTFACASNAVKAIRLGGTSLYLKCGANNLDTVPRSTVCA